VVQAVFAVNGRYFLNEKHAMAIAAGLRIRPERLADTITDVLAATGRTPTRSSKISRMTAPSAPRAHLRIEG
jgi:hypothetical protein